MVQTRVQASKRSSHFPVALIWIFKLPRKSCSLHRTPLTKVTCIPICSALVGCQSINYRKETPSSNQTAILHFVQNRRNSKQPSSSPTVGRLFFKFSDQASRLFLLSNIIFPLINPTSTSNSPDSPAFLVFFRLAKFSHTAEKTL